MYAKDFILAMIAGIPCSIGKCLERVTKAFAQGCRWQCFF